MLYQEASNLAAARESQDDFISQINVTPLVDVMLVLLIILMVTSSYVVARALGVDLPQAASSTSAGPERVLNILVQADGSYVLDDAKIALTELRSRLRLRSKSQSSALVSADGEAAHKHIVALLDLLKQEGVRELAIGVRQVSEQP